LIEVTKSDAFHLPSIYEILDKVSGADYWSTDDLMAGFYQIEVSVHSYTIRYLTPLTLFIAHDLKIQPENCQLFRQRGPFWTQGHKVTAIVLPEKCGGSWSVPSPEVGYYRRFVPNFAQYQELLTNLTRAKVFSTKPKIASARSTSSKFV
jgi:hypothetical protein